MRKESLGTVSGKEYVAAKDHRLTAVLCVNATGTHKIKPMIIGSKPRYLSSWERDGKVLYSSNKASWMNGKELVKWITAFDEEMAAM